MLDKIRTRRVPNSVSENDRLDPIRRNNIFKRRKGPGTRTLDHYPQVYESYNGGVMSHCYVLSRDTENV